MNAFVAVVFLFECFVCLFQMMPDSDSLEEIKKSQPLDAAKLALIVGLIPRFSELSLLL